MESLSLISASKLRNRNSQIKRKLNVLNWKQVRSKVRRNNGVQYVSATTDQNRPAVEPPADEDRQCTMNCMKPGCGLIADRYFTIFTEFWSYGSYDVQTSILTRLVKKVAVAQRTINPNQSRRSSSYRYFLPNEEGIELEVCQRTFLRVFAIHKSRLECLQTKLSSGRLMFFDERGRHENRPSRLTNNIKEEMGNHIDMFPTYLSHYQRQHGDPERRYLSPDLTMSGMFQLFVAGYGPEAESWFWAYKQIIREKGLKIGSPKTDTCSMCDELKIRIDSLSLQENQEELHQAYLERIEHQTNAEYGYDALRRDMERGMRDDSFVPISVDMQGVLFSPILTNPEYYYMRKLGTHNLAIVNANGFATMCVWHATEGKKGSSEVSSCILKYDVEKFQPLNPEQQRTLVIWSDRSTGQNNNQFILILFRYLIANNYFTTVAQKFLTTGHTFLPADRQFALIETNRKKSTIYSPDDYLEVIRNANREKPNRLQRMIREDFKNFSILTPYFTKPRTLKVTEVKWIRLEREEPNSIFTKYEMDSVIWRTHVVTTQRPLIGLRLDNLYPNQIPLSAALLRDLRFLLRWVPQQHRHNWDFLEGYPETNANDQV